jgi:hypothetical protein
VEGAEASAAAETECGQFLRGGIVESCDEKILGVVVRSRFSQLYFCFLLIVNV